MSDQGVPRRIKEQAKRLLSLARERHICLDWLPDESQLDDPVVVEHLFKNLKPPSNERLFQAMALASLHGIELPPKVASSKYACDKFIREHPLDDTDRALSDSQKRTLSTLEEYLEADAPLECWVSERAWERYFRRTIDRDEVDKAYEIIIDLQIPLAGVDLRSLGWQVAVLLIAKKAQADKEGARRRRVEEMLIEGEDPYVIADALAYPITDVITISNALEASGHELPWA